MFSPVAKSQKGFTIIEVLIALALTAVASAIAYSSLDNSIKLAEGAEKEADRLHRLNRVFDVLSKDLRQVTSRSVRDPDGGDYVSAFYFNESTEPMMALSKGGWMNPQPERFQRSELQRVNYHYDGEKLIRYSWQMMDRYDDSKRQEIVLLEDVESFEVQMLTPNALSQSLSNAGGSAAVDTTWVKQWPPQQNNVSSGFDRLPIAVEIKIEIKDWGEIRRVYEVVGNAI